MGWAGATTAVPPPPAPRTGRVARPRHLQVAAFLAATAWYFCASALAGSAANGLGYRFGLGVWQPVLEGLFQVFLVVVGLSLLAGVERRRAPLRLLLGLPLRRTARKEWAEGAALGWGISLGCVLLMLGGGLPDVRLWTAPPAWEIAVLNVVALGLLSLAFALGLFGYGFERLREGVGPVRATVILCLAGALYAAFSAPVGQSSGGRVLVGALAGLVLSVCWLRTHGVWLVWGLMFGWVSVTGVLFGLPLAGSTTYAALVDMRARGPVWLTGGAYGPLQSLPLLALMVAVLPVLVKITSDYAWEYTHPPIIPAGYVVDVPAPAAHGEVERAAATPVLVQILPTTPQEPNVRIPPV